MRRRDFITGLGSTAALSVAAHAQQGDRMRRIGLLTSYAEGNPEGDALLKGFRQGLGKLGWSESRNVRIDYRYAAAITDRFQPLAKELLDLKPDVILAHSTPIAAAFQRESRTVPIVFVSVSDPIGSGLVASLARPGGNLTGLLLFEEGITAKWLAMLKEIAPGLALAALMANPKTTPYDYFLRAARVAAQSLAIEIVPGIVENAADIEHSIESFARVPNGGLVMLPSTTTILNRDLVVAMAARHRLPAVYYDRTFVTAGGLMSYDTDSVDRFQLAASYVDRILRGAKAGDLPVQAPVTYKTILNLKTAMALGLTVPPALLVRADEVIE